MVTLYGMVAVTFMMTMYALERRRRHFTLAFALGCVLSSIYGFLSGAWPFGLVELVWSAVAVHKWSTAATTARNETTNVSLRDNFEGTGNPTGSARP